jgi:pilus assembly protein Flp/PilA
VLLNKAPAGKRQARSDGRRIRPEAKAYVLLFFNSLQGVSKMKELMKKMMAGAIGFSRDEEGAQVVEYALIIAVVSIALVIALSTIASSGGSFSAFVTRVTNCLTLATCT